MKNVLNRLALYAVGGCAIAAVLAALVGWLNGIDFPHLNATEGFAAGTCRVLTVVSILSAVFGGWCLYHANEAENQRDQSA